MVLLFLLIIAFLMVMTFLYLDVTTPISRDAALESTGLEPVADEVESVYPEPPSDESSNGESLGESPEEQDNLNDVMIDKYIFNHLGATEQRIYKKIYRAVTDMEESVGLDMDEVNALDRYGLLDIFSYVLDDHPDIYWVEPELGTSTQMLGTVPVGTSLLFTYSMDWSQRDAFVSEIDRYTQTCLAGIDSDASDYDKILHVYEYIIDHSVYDIDSLYNQDIVSVFVEGRSVCKGYAKATQYLLNQLGIFCLTVNGYAKGQGAHSWSIVGAGGDYYYLDTTWGDPVVGDSFPPGYDNIKYDYFLVTENEIAHTHDIQEKYDLPTCNGTALNYYTAEGRLLMDFDMDKLSQILREDILANKDKSTFRFADNETYQYAIEELFVNGQVYQLIDRVPEFSSQETVSYLTNDDMNILHILYR